MIVDLNVPRQRKMGSNRADSIVSLASGGTRTKPLMFGVSDNGEGRTNIVASIVPERVLAA
jgi:hypothetical protein